MTDQTPTTVATGVPETYPTRKITYEAKDSAGKATHGTAGTTDLAAWVQGRYDAGWRQLVVRENGQQVGGIIRDAGSKHWWAEA